MGITFVVNPGSTSRKYAWYRGHRRLLTVTVETSPAGLVAFATNSSGTTKQLDSIPTSLVTALPFALTIAKDHGVYQSPTACSQAVLRVVAPGEQFACHQWLRSSLEADLADAATLVPLHIPIVQAELRVLTEALPEVPVALASDSAFHSTQDIRVRQTGLKNKDEVAHAWRRFGYHGLSVASIGRQLTARVDMKHDRTVVCHLGGGVSVTALSAGVSVATSMGLTPTSGVAMGTRGGDMSADELAALLSTGALTLNSMWRYLYSETGWMGKVAIADLRALLDAASDPKSDAATVLRRFAYQVQSYVASYMVLLNGLDRIVLTGTAALRNSYIRNILLQDLAVLGVRIDEAANESLRGSGVISATDSAVVVEVLANDEFGEMVYALDSITT